MRARVVRFAAAFQSLLLIATLVVPALAAATEISTDLWVYQDGDTVTVTGIDFGANEVVDFVTTDPDGVVVDTGSASSDELGGVVYAFVLHATQAGIYDVVGTGATSGLTATTQFDPNPSIDNPSTAEGNAGSHVLTFTVGVSGSTGTLWWRTQASGTATEGASCGGTVDYIAIPTTSATKSAGFTIDVTVCGDATAEVNDTFTVQVADNAGFSGSGGNKLATGTGSITNDDNVATVSTTGQAEGDVNGTIQFSVSLSNPVPATGQVKVNWSTTDGTATSGSCPSGADFNAASSTVTINAGSSTGNFSVVTCGDTTLEGNDSFTVAISANNSTNTNVVIGSPATGSGTLNNDDTGAVTVSTIVKNAATNATTTSLPLGGGAYDTATLAGVPSGFSLDGVNAVTYSYWAGNSTCTGAPTSTDSVNVTGGVVGQSASHLNLGAGNYSFKAHYNGNLNYAASTGDVCEPFSVALAATTVSTVVKNAATNATVSAPLALGSGAYDTATLSGAVGSFSLDGVNAVTYSYWAGNSTCTGAPTSTDSVNVTGGVVGQSASHLNLGAGNYSFKAHYNGNLNYAASTGDVCEPFSVALAATTVSTVVKNAATNATVSAPLALGSGAYDTATLSGAVGSFSLDGVNAVTYSYWAGNSTCTGAPTSTDSVNVTGGVVGQSASHLNLGAGNYSFKAHYNGNLNYAASTGDVCEPFSVDKGTPTIVTHVHDGLHNDITGTSVASGTSVHDTSTITGGVAGFSVGGPGVDVFYSLYNSIDCSGTAVSTESRNVNNAGSVQDSTSVTPGVGPHSYSVAYEGTSNYNGSTALCEPFTVVSANTAPSVDAGGPYSGNEGSAISLDGTVNDPDSDPLTYHWTINYNGNMDAGGSCSFFDEFAIDTTVACNDDSNGGAFILTLTVSGDPEGDVSDTAQLTVANANPTGSLGNNSPINEGSSATATFSGQADASTRDSAVGLHYAFSCTNGDLSAATYAGSGTATGVNCFFGSDGSFTVKGRIIDKDGGFFETTTVVTVNDVDPTGSADDDPVTVDEGQTANNTGTYSDPGGDSVALTASVGSVIDTGSGTWSWSFATTDGPDDSQSVTIYGNDGSGPVAIATFGLTVNNVTPTGTADNASVTVDEGDPAGNTGTYSDPGDDPITLSASKGSVVDNLDGTWSWSFNTTDGPDDSDTITIYGDDGDGAGPVAIATFGLTVNNVTPTGTADNASVTVDEGDPAGNTGTYSDPGDDPITLSASKGSVVDNLDGTWSWSFNTTDGPDDSDTITIYGDDGDGAGPVAIATFGLTVNNVTPTGTADNASVTVDEGDPAGNTGTYSDPGDDPITLSASKGSVVDNLDGTWSWSFNTTDGPDDSDTITIYGDDGDGAGPVAIATFGLTVNNVTPTGTADNASVTVDEGDPAGNTGTYSDPGDDPITLSASKGSVVDNLDGTWSWSFNTTDGPDDSDTITIYGDDGDGAGPVAIATFGLTVNNVEPTLTISGNASVNEGSLYSLTLSAYTDPGVDTATNIRVNWGDGSFTDGLALGVRTHTYADGLNNYNITVDITDEDGTFLDQANARAVQVNNVEPTLTISGNASVNEGSLYSLTLSAYTDPGVDTATNIRVNWGDGSFTDGLALGVRTHTYADGLNNYNITVDITDEDGTFLDQANARAVQVNNVKPTPTITSITGTGGAACIGGNTVTLGFSWTDPAGANDIYSYDVNWGDGSAHATGSNTTSPISGLTHSYAAGGPYTITVTVNDEDPGIGGSVSSASPISFLYVSSGILQPINLGAQRSSFKLGSTIPVKVRITDCNGVWVPGLVLTVHLQKIDSSPDSVNEAIVASNPDPGTTMRYSSGDGQYIFNMSTKLSVFNGGADLTQGTYRIWITSNPPSTPTIEAYIDTKK